MIRYAWREVLLIIGGGIVATVLLYWFTGWWALAPALLTIAVVAFFRDPVRSIPDATGAVLAPADGKIVSITRDDAAQTLKILVFLSVFNVHINRSPCAGRVMTSLYQPGRFLNALSDRSTDENESNTLTLEPDAPLPGPIAVRQIAGALARRIVCAACVGDRLAAGERFGMIKLGSRTELTLPRPDDWEVTVAVGQAVQAGLTTLARLKNLRAEPLNEGLNPNGR